MDLTKHNCQQLREWLRTLGRQTSGNKAALVLRLNEIPANERGQCPGLDLADDDCVANAVADDGGITNYVVDDEGAAAGVVVDGSHQDDNANESDDAISEVMMDEVESLRQQLAKLAEENRLLKKSKEALDKVDGAVIPESQNPPISVLKEFLSDFDGSGDVKIWAEQFENLAKVYNLNNETKRVLFMSKLKGRSQQWLHSKADYITKDISILISELVELFGTKVNILKLRKTFEMRKWRVGESFAQYCEEKCAVAVTLKMREDELIEYLIDGIPSPNLRIQANVLCLNTKAQLLQAFSKIELESSHIGSSVGKVGANTSTGTGVFRCYNCYGLDHMANVCPKPKRERGSCFVCGKMGHRAAECPEKKKKQLLTLDDDVNDYVRVFNFHMVFDSNISFSAACLIDSGSPINFIKLNTLKKNNIKMEILYDDLNYYGLNKAKLKILGKINCFVIIENKHVNFEFLVVANESMEFEAVLGRNFMRKCHIKLVFEYEINKFSNNDNNTLSCSESVTRTDELDNKQNADCKNIMNYEVKEVMNNNENEEIMRKYENREIVNSAEKIAIMNNYENEEKIVKECVNEILLIDCDSIDEKNSLRIGEGVSGADKFKLMKIFENFYVNPLRPVEPRLKCEMKLTLEKEKPFHFPVRRLSYCEKTQLQKLLDEYLEKGYIRSSCSEYASAIVLVKKKTGDLRMCVDYRSLNKITAKDNYPLPMIDDLLDKLVQKNYFSKLDLKNGFFHVFVHQDSIKYTSFVTPLGQYEWLRMPFGLKNAPSVFQRYVNTIFADMIRQNKLIIYMDDILVATFSLEEHLDILKEIFSILLQNKLELRVDKCEFLKSKIKYLGYEIDYGGIKPDEKGVEAIKNFAVPTNVHEVQRFLGLGSYFRRFIKDFSTLAKPLYDLLRKNKVFTFGEKELNSFEIIKKKLSESPILAIYDPKDETELHCDASSVGFGAILMQRKADGRMHPIFYFSKRTTELESKYHSFELETLAIVYALKRFRVYLDGKPFKIITDCNSLTLTLSKKELNPRIARWALDLQNFEYSLEHRPNTRMQHVDALSRTSHVMILETNTLEENLIVCQNKDDELCKIKKLLEESENKSYELRNGILYRKINKNSILFYVPCAMENHVLRKYHDEMGHVGITKTLELIRKTYWFPNMRDKVEEYIKNCLKCIAFSSKTRTEGFLHNIPKGSLPFDVIHVDHYGPVENIGRSKKHVFLIIDANTKFLRLYATKTTNTKEVILALKDFFRSYSRPKTLVSDRGSCFTSTEFKEFLVANNVQHVKIATASPQANGQVERINRSLGPMLAKLVELKDNVSWDKILENVEFALNNTINRSIGEYPSVLLFGVGQRGKVIDTLKENHVDLVKEGKQRNLIEFRDEAKKRQKNLQEYNQNYVNRGRVSPRQFKVGDYVMIRNFDSHTSGPKKLIPKFKGPYEVFKVLGNDRYLVRDVENLQQTQIPYEGVWAVSNIRPWFNVKTG